MENQNQNPKNIIRPLIFGFIGLAVLVALLGFILIEWQIHRTIKNGETERNFIIEDGQSVKKISQNLNNQGFIRDPFYFELYVWSKKQEKNFQAGIFILPSSANIIQIGSILTGKPIPPEIEITLIEGWDRRNIDQYLASLGLIQKEDFIVATQKFANSPFADFFEAPAGISDEGFLFPDTYRVYKKDFKINDLLKKMANNFRQKVTPALINDAKNKNQSLYEILTLASIIEKESAESSEMAKVAGVFYNRLKINMPLESDATVNYVTGKKLRQPTLEDTEQDSRYNTYRYKGLPPGPICNPSLNAIKAAIYPEEHNYFYFLHPENGETIFSKTLEEHNANKAKYLP